MRLCTYKQAGKARLGFAIDETTLVPVADAYREAKLEAPPATMMEAIELLGAPRAALDQAWATAVGAKHLHASTGNIEWLPPVRGYKILGVAINNDAISKIAEKSTANPATFLKAPSSLIGHGQPVIIRPEYGLTHPEGELGVVIGRRGKFISRDGAFDHVFGYTVMNDITSVSMKSEDTYVWANPGFDWTPPGFEFGNMQLAYHGRSKSTDGFGPSGPWIVTRDEVADPNDLAVRVYMGDELCAEDHTRNLRHSVPQVIEWLSKFYTLEPGDIIHMGTAAHGKYGLRELDFQSWDGPCTVEIEKIGRLVNPIVRQDIEGRPVQAKPKATAKPWPPRMKSPR